MISKDKHRFNGHFASQPELASCPLDSQVTVIIILKILTAQAKTLHTHMALWAVPRSLQLIAILRGFEAKFLQAGCPSCCRTNNVKALKATLLTEV